KRSGDDAQRDRQTASGHERHRVHAYARVLEGAGDREGGGQVADAEILALRPHAIIDGLALEVDGAMAGDDRLTGVEQHGAGIDDAMVEGEIADEALHVSTGWNTQCREDRFAKFETH